jgi:hypothetical protein
MNRNREDIRAAERLRRIGMRVPADPTEWAQLARVLGVAADVGTQVGREAVAIAADEADRRRQLDLAAHAAAPPSGVPSTERGEGGKPLTLTGGNRVGRKPLTIAKSETEKAKHNVYELIRAAKEKNPGWGKKSMLNHFKSDNQFKELLKMAGLKLNDRLFHNALEWIKDNSPGQETRSGNVS